MTCVPACVGQDGPGAEAKTVMNVLAFFRESHISKYIVQPHRRTDITMEETFVFSEFSAK
jgi:hypothetical protein